MTSRYLHPPALPVATNQQLRGRYVPDYYGHGTVNLLASIGIAFEFENFNHKLYNTDVASMRRVQVSAPASYRSLE